jgi:hypothetical protein
MPRLLTLTLLLVSLQGCDAGSLPDVPGVDGGNWNGSSTTGGTSGNGSGGANGGPGGDKSDGTHGGNGNGAGGATGGGTGGTGGNKNGNNGNAGNSGGNSGNAGTGGASGPWRYSRAVNLDTTAAGAGVMGDVPKYPVAVVLDGTSFDFSQAKPDGTDVRFFASDGSPLPHEIESWDSTAKVAAIWVKVDIKGNNNSQPFTMKWGNPSATDASNSQAVFDTKDGFLGVWHLSEPGSTTADGYKDSTATGANAAGVALTTASSSDGRVGKAALLAHAQQQWIQVPVAKSHPYDIFNQMTNSIWVQPKSHAVEYQCMFSKGEGGFRIHYYGIDTWDENKGKHLVETCLKGAGDQCALNLTGTDVAPGANWYHMVAVYDHPKISLYINGVLQKTEMDSGTWRSDPTKPVMIGNNSSVTTRSFDGLVDEARILNVPKDPSWIKLDYESQRPGQKFLTFGQTQSN